MSAQSYCRGPSQGSGSHRFVSQFLDQSRSFEIRVDGVLLFTVGHSETVRIYCFSLTHIFSSRLDERFIMVFFRLFKLFVLYNTCVFESTKTYTHRCGTKSAERRTHTHMMSLGVVNFSRGCHIFYIGDSRL